MNENNISPLRYPGGKTRACKTLDNILSQYFDLKKVQNVISPFFGGGSFEFYLQNKYNFQIIANDLFTPLYSFWKICCDEEQKNEMINILSPFCGNIEKEYFMNLRNKILEESDILKRATYYFILNRCSFSGSTLSGGFSKEASKKRFTQSSIERIKSLNLKRFDIFNEDFPEFLKKYGKIDGSIIFLDPPYYLEKGSKLYGKDGDLHKDFDHIKLHEILSELKNWMLTYNDCSYIRELYRDFKIVEYDTKYSLRKNKELSEIIILGI